MKEIETIAFTDENGEAVELCVIEQTTLNGRNYLLVAENDDESEEAQAYIMRENTVLDEDSSDAVYEMVDDENELAAVAGIFSELVDEEMLLDY